MTEDFDIDVQAQFGQEPAPPPKVVKFLRQHEKFSEIHYDVIEGKKTAAQIAKKYNLRTAAGNYAINALLRYRSFLDERFAPLFAKANEMQLEILRNEFLDKQRTAFELAESDHKEAMKGKRKNFGAAKAMLDVMTNTASEIGKAVQIGLPQNGPQKVTNNKQVIMMALPKQLPNSTPVKVIEASKSA